MIDSYLVELKESVFRETSLARIDCDENVQIAFTSKTEAEEWVTAQNRDHANTGQLILQTAHPDDTSGVDAYIVFQRTRGGYPESEAQ